MTAGAFAFSRRAKAPISASGPLVWVVGANQTRRFERKGERGGEEERRRGGTVRDEHILQSGDERGEGEGYGYGFVLVAIHSRSRGGSESSHRIER